MLNQLTNQLRPIHHFLATSSDNANLTLQFSELQMEHNLNMSTLAERVIQERTAKGWRKVDLLRAAKIKNASVLTAIEQGTSLHSPQLPAIAHALGVDVLWLQTGKGHKYPGRPSVADPFPHLPLPQTEQVPPLDLSASALLAMIDKLDPVERAMLLTGINAKYLEPSGEHPKKAKHTKAG
jgi:transcriptional regulator with XRE-family HTH domain